MSGGATLREVHSAIPDPPASIYGIRTLLSRLVRKGLLRTRRSGRHSELLYVAVSERSDVKLQAFDRIAREHTRLVCGLNLDLVTGVIDGSGCRGVTASLEPSPGRCCVSARLEPPNGD